MRGRTSSEVVAQTFHHEKYEADVAAQDQPTAAALAPLAVAIALKLAEIERFTGRTAPTVIT